MAKQHYTHNHYVPEWYQKRFLPPGQHRFHYLDLTPDVVPNNGRPYTRNGLQRWGPGRCFAQDDLYTTDWYGLKNREIEQFFFGEIDSKGRAAVEFFSDYEIRGGMHGAFEDLIAYISVQKLRTPKGLRALAWALRLRSKNHLLLQLQNYANMHGATWTDAVWQIASADASATKFIITDHPVTVYNRRCFPGSRYCGQVMDPDIRLVATHTLFPLSIDRILILTNLAWARNPYQNELRFGPNTRLFRHTIFNGLAVQRGRQLNELEVSQINYIMKRRARRYIAAAEREWLYPEESLPSTHWSKFGDGYLLMPDPRELHMGGEIYVGYADGTTATWNEYGQRPWEQGFKDSRRENRESGALERFQDEFAARYGRELRGWSESLGGNGPRPDNPEYHKQRLERAAKRGVRSREL